MHPARETGYRSVMTHENENLPGSTTDDDQDSEPTQNAPGEQSPTGQAQTAGTETAQAPEEDDAGES
jgi:hypothetical protein